MIDLTISEYGYVSMTSRQWIESCGEFSEALTTAARVFLGETRPESPSNFYVSDTHYATDERVLEFCKALDPEASGLHGEGDAWHIGSTYNSETLLDDDVVVTLVSTWEFGELMIVHGYGYMYSWDDSVEVYRLRDGMESTVSSLTSGWAGHETAEAQDACGAEWIIESPGTLWLNGGGSTVRIDETIEDGQMLCPECKTRLVPSAN
jgi:hypothetical protein